MRPTFLPRFYVEVVAGRFVETVVVVVLPDYYLFLMK
jgi:hypothetical protein